MHVSDCVDAVVGRIDATTPFEVFNLGIDDYCTVTESAGWIAGSRWRRTASSSTPAGTAAGLATIRSFTSQPSGARAAGWAPSFTIREAVESTVDYLLAEPWLLDATA